MVLRKYFLSLLLFFSFDLPGVPLDSVSPINTPPNVPPDAPLNAATFYDNEGEKLPPTFSAANAEAIYWLNLVDQGQYRATWGSAADLFKDVVGTEQWEAAMKGSRSPLGSLRSRKLTKYEQVVRLPHGTKGYFMIIEFRSQFSNKAYADEIVTLVSQGSQSLTQWKVLSYHLRYK